MPISQELPNFDFSADLEDIAETRFKANLDKDSAKWQDALFAEYMKAGAPKQRRKWITDRIKDALSRWANGRHGSISRTST